ncbi:hypothetical protein [Nocardia farcinica]|nr:hypothetical protein [Nocardia farcinica]
MTAHAGDIVTYDAQRWLVVRTGHGRALLKPLTPGAYHRVAALTRLAQAAAAPTTT